MLRLCLTTAGWRLCPGDSRRAALLNCTGLQPRISASIDRAIPRVKHGCKQQQDRLTHTKNGYAGTCRAAVRDGRRTDSTAAVARARRGAVARGREGRRRVVPPQGVDGRADVPKCAFVLALIKLQVNIASIATPQKKKPKRSPPRRARSPQVPQLLCAFRSRVLRAGSNVRRPALVAQRAQGVPEQRRHARGPHAARRLPLLGRGHRAPRRGTARRGPQDALDAARVLLRLAVEARRAVHGRPRPRPNPNAFEMSFCGEQACLCGEQACCGAYTGGVLVFPTTPSAARPTVTRARWFL